MLRIRICRSSIDILIASNAAQRKRLLSCLPSLCKKYKYALDPKKQISTPGSGVNQYRQKRKGVSIVDGKALTYFAFDTIDESEFSAVESPKQRAYAEIVHSAIDALLTAREAPKEIQDCVIEIVHVEVAPCLTAATVVWKLPDYSESKYSKEDTAALLHKHLPELRLLLPAYSTVTQTPTVHFAYDIFSIRQKEIDALFDIAKTEEEEYFKTVVPSETAD